MHVYISGSFCCRGNNSRAHISNSYQLESDMNAFGQLLFSVTHPSAAWDISEYDWNSFNTENFSIFCQLHLHFSWFSAFEPEITFLSFSLCTVLNIHALVFISSWAAPSSKSFPLEASHYRSVCCVLGLALSLRMIVLNSLRRRLIFWIRICCCSTVIDKVYIITSSSNNRAELILEAQKELKLSSVLSFLQLKAKTIAFWL